MSAERTRARSSSRPFARGGTADRDTFSVRTTPRSRMIKCPYCHFDNEDGALFCEQCKSDLAAPAPVVAAPVPVAHGETHPDVPTAEPLMAEPVAEAVEGVPAAVPYEPIPEAQPA